MFEAVIYEKEKTLYKTVDKNRESVRDGGSGLR